MKKTFIVLSFFLCLLASCGGNEYPLVVKEKSISKNVYGEKWPFSVEDGVLQCVQYAESSKNSVGIVFVSNGKTYGVNGIASSWGNKLGYSDIAEIWMIDRKIMGKDFKIDKSKEQMIARKSISPIIKDGLNMFKSH